MTTERPARTRKHPREGKRVINLERYAPAYLTWIANKLSRGASHNYLKLFHVGIETWRCLVLLAIDESISALQVSRIIDMDKASVSRCFKSMQTKGLVTMGLDANDGQYRDPNALTEEDRDTGRRFRRDIEAATPVLDLDFEAF